MIEKYSARGRRGGFHRSRGWRWCGRLCHARSSGRGRSDRCCGRRRFRNRGSGHRRSRGAAWGRTIRSVRCFGSVTGRRQGSARSKERDCRNARQPGGKRFRGCRGSFHRRESCAIIPLRASKTQGASASPGTRFEANRRGLQSTFDPWATRAQRRQKYRGSRTNSASFAASRSMRFSDQSHNVFAMNLQRTAQRNVAQGPSDRYRRANS